MSLIYFEDMIHYYHTPTLEDIMIEVGDMIQYNHCSEYNNETDIGWVVYVEKHRREEGTARLIYVQWLLEDSVDSVWEHHFEGYDQFTIVKGGQHER